jgi:hypothetical protein
MLALLSFVRRVDSAPDPGKTEYDLDEVTCRFLFRGKRVVDNVMICVMRTCYTLIATEK